MLPGGQGQGRKSLIFVSNSIFDIFLTLFDYNFSEGVGAKLKPYAEAYTPISFFPQMDSSESIKLSAKSSYPFQNTLNAVKNFVIISTINL